jgi:DNA-binding response OmpR family regulator
MTRIFTVVPDDRVSQQIATSLQLEGFLVDSAITARDALYCVTGGGYEFVIVEYGIADIDAAGNVERCVRMLKSGADDYQPSPLDFEELGARVLGLLRVGRARSRQALPAPSRNCRQPASRSIAFDEP